MDSNQIVEELTSRGFPVGNRGREVLSLLGRLEIPLAVRLPEPDKYKGLLPRWLQWLSPFRVNPPPVHRIQHVHHLSFTSRAILNACAQDPLVLVHCVCFSLGKLVSVVAATSEDRVILVDEASSAAYVWDILSNWVVGVYSFECVLNGLLGNNWNAVTRITDSPDDFEWDESVRRQFGI